MNNDDYEYIPGFGHTRQGNEKVVLQTLPSTQVEQIRKLAQAMSNVSHGDTLTLDSAERLVTEPWDQINARLCKLEKQVEALSAQPAK